MENCSAENSFSRRSLFIVSLQKNYLAMNNKKNKNADLENKRSIFFLVGLTFSLGIVFLAFQWKTQPKAAIDLGTTSFVTEDYIYIPPTVPEKKEPPAKLVEVPFFVLVDNNSDILENPDLFDTEATEEMDINFDKLVFNSKENKNDKVKEIFVFVEEMPEFPGGELALRKYLTNAVKYPLIAQENGIQGKVYVSFIIDESGAITHIELLRGIDSSLDNEALRVVRTLPKWKPGKQAGKAVKVRYNVPIHFELQ